MEYFINLDVEVILNYPKEELDEIEVPHYYESLLAWYLGQLSSLSGNSRGIVDLNRLSWDHIKYYRFPEEVDKYLTILNFLCSIYPEKITDKLLKTPTILRITQIIEILNNHKLEDELNENICCICLSSYEFQLIENTCLCRSKIHVNCLIELVKRNGDICRTCNSTKHSFIDQKQNVHFPTINLFKELLMASYVFFDKNDILKLLYYSLSYLMIDKVKEIIDKMDKEEFIKSMIKCGHGYLPFDYKIYKEQNKFILKNSFGFVRDENFTMIEQLLNRKLEN